jgi:hypothetical protein
MKMRNPQEEKEHTLVYKRTLSSTQNRRTSKHTHLAAIMLLAFKSTISSKPTAKMSTGGDSSSGTSVTLTRAGKKTKTIIH